MKLQLKTVLLGLTGIAIVLVMLGSLVLSLAARIRVAHHRMAAETQRLGSAGVPLLLNSLVLGDLASAEQTLDNLNADRVWRDVRLYESNGRTLILDASPHQQRVSSVPAWVRRLMPLKVTEARIPIEAHPVVYGTALNAEQREYLSLVNSSAGALLELINDLLDFSKIVLDRLGHHARVVSDGRAALAALDTGAFDLVLMDVQMPEMDGLDAAPEDLVKLEGAVAEVIAFLPMPAGVR